MGKNPPVELVSVRGLPRSMHPWFPSILVATPTLIAVFAAAYIVHHRVFPAALLAALALVTIGALGARAPLRTDAPRRANVRERKRNKPLFASTGRRLTTHGKPSAPCAPRLARSRALRSARDKGLAERFRKKITDARQPRFGMAHERNGIGTLPGRPSPRPSGKCRSSHATPTSASF